MCFDSEEKGEARIEEIELEFLKRKKLRRPIQIMLAAYVGVVPVSSDSL